MLRITSGIFSCPGHRITYSQKTGYLNCICHEFAFAGKCDPAIKAKEILKSEGKEVKFKRVPKPVFIQEIENFKKVFREVIEL